MANYYGYTRTNHFSVTDPDKLADIVHRIRWGEGELSFLSEEDGKYCFGAYATVCGLAVPVETEEQPDGADDKDIHENDDAYEDDDAEYNADDVYTALQEIVAPDDAIIITEVGYEKLRYLTGYALVITRDSIECVNLCNAALEKARGLLNNPEYTTKNEY